MMKDKTLIQSALFGVAVGDALGVPVEFQRREIIRENPVTDMIGYGTYNQPAGTWSDDSSLTFCLAEALTEEFNIQTIGENFVKWYDKDYWTAHGEVFDIGNTTRRSIISIAHGQDAETAGENTEASNGNGSLMRILPLVFYLIDKPIEERFKITKQVSCVTHGHIRSVIACFYYLEFAMKIMEGKDKFQIYKELQIEVTNHLNNTGIATNEIALFNRLLEDDINDVSEELIYSSGYVLHTLEASIWCLLSTDTYVEAVLKAVNLGLDTDTTGAVVGGLAGILYGFDNIPQHWLAKIARYEDIDDLSTRLANKQNFSNP